MSSSFDPPVPTTPKAVDGRQTSLVSWLSALRKVYESGALGDPHHELVPDLPSSSREMSLYFMLAPALNYQRRSETLWRAAMATYNDPETRFVFEPESASLGLDVVREGLVRHGLAVQSDRQSRIWFVLLETLRRDFQGDPRRLFAKCDYDIAKVKTYVTSHKRDFPYLSGPKLLNYWLYMTSLYTAAEFVNRDQISIIPDLHVIRATVQLDLIKPQPLPTAVEVERVWSEALAGTGLAPCDYHAPLWRWSRAGFPPLEDFVH